MASFPEFRRALLAALGSRPALSDWRARGDDDFGVMLLEMWAYVSDVLAFYDEVIANETYLRTARLRPSLRRLVDLLGYVPRPGVAATVELAAVAEGQQPILMPAGTAFRSGAFDGNPPQVFELGAPAAVDPLANQWSLARVRPSGPGPGPLPFLLLRPGTAKLEKGDVAVLSGPATSDVSVRTVTEVASYEGADGASYTRVDVSSPITLPSDAALAQLELLTPTATASLWRLPTLSSDPAPISSNGTVIVLDGLHRTIRSGTLVLLSKTAEYSWFRVKQVREVMRTVIAAGTSQLTDAAGNVTGSISVPATTVPVTEVTLDAAIDSRKPTATSPDWASSSPIEIDVHYGLVDAGTLAVEASGTLAPGDLLRVAGRLQLPESPPSRFLLEDGRGDGLSVTGTLDFTTGELALDQTVEWEEALAAPVLLYGNVITASRGESIRNEVLGSGDASLTNQSFKLKKKPLTYLPSPTAGNEQGVASTLRVYVNRILWTEVPSFFGAAGDARVFVVRQNDEGDSLVTFGDGVRGSRLPSGTGNVVAFYRFGAGQASPPAGSINQLAKPVKGLRSVRNPLSASGGADAEPPSALRTFAPRSALLLGRVVSIPDMEAAAAGVDGVRVASAEWRWNPARQRPVAQVYYAGDPGLETRITQRVRALADPTTPIDVDPATPLPRELAIDVQVDARYLEEDVLTGVRDALLDADAGILTPERVGIGRPLYRSRIFEAVLGVEGAVSVRGLAIGGSPFPDFAVSPGAGAYFDFEAGPLLLNGKAA